MFPAALADRIVSQLSSPHNKKGSETQINKKIP